MHRTSAESVSSDALMQTYYGEVLDETLNRTLRMEGSAQGDWGQPLTSAYAAHEAAVAAALEEVKRRVMPILNTSNPAFSADHLTILTTAVDAFDAIKTVTYREWGDSGAFWSILSPKDFSDLLDLRLGVQMDIRQFTLNLKAYAQLLSIFENLYFSKAMVFKPRISSDQLAASDPFFRGLVREVNMRDAEVDALLFSQQFSIKEFVVKCMATFFPYVDHPVIGEDTFAHIKTLRLVLMLFEYGLWTVDEMNMLLGQLYQCATRLRNFERLFQGQQEAEEMEEDLTLEHRKTVDVREADSQLDGPGRAKPDEEAQEATLSAKVCRQLVQARILVAKILKHIVAMHFDLEVEVSYSNMGLAGQPTFGGIPRAAPRRTIAPAKVFAFDRFKKKRLYTHYSYILINYLLRAMPTMVSETQPQMTDKLDQINSSLLAFASNLKADFYLNSLLSLDPATLPSYLLCPHQGVRGELQRAFRNLQKQMGAIFASPDLALGRIPDAFSELFLGSLRNMTALVTRCGSMEELKSLQIAFTLSRMDHLLLSSLSNLLKAVGEDRASVLNPYIEKTFDFLVLVTKDNLQCVNSFFSFYILKHFMQLYERRPLHGAFLLMQLLRNRHCTRLFIVHEKVKAFVLRKLGSDIEELLAGLSGTDCNVSHECVLRIVFLCKLTKSVIKENDGDSMRTSNQFGAMLLAHFESVLAAISRIQGASVCAIDADFDSLIKVEHLVSRAVEIAATDCQHRQYLGLIALEYLLGLFATSTRSLYRPEVHATVTAVFDQPAGAMAAFLPLVHSSLGIKIFRKYLKIYSNFRIFDQNCYMHNAFEKNLFELYLVKTAAATQICKDLEDCVSVLAERFEAATTLSPALVKLAYKGCLPMMFKFVSGFLAAYTDERFKDSPVEAQRRLTDIVRKMEDGTLEIQQALESNLRPPEQPTASTKRHRQLLLQFLHDVERQHISRVPRKTLTNKIDGLKGSIFGMMSGIVRAYLIRPEFFPKISEYYSFSLSSHEDALQKRMATCLISHLKFRSEYGVSEEDVAKKDRVGQLPVTKTFMPVQRGVCRPINISLVRTLDHDPAEADPFRVFALPDTSGDGPQQVVAFYRQRYWRLKSEMMDRLGSNQIFRIFRFSDPIYQNTKVFVDFFAGELQHIPLDLGSNSSSFFSLNERYQTLFIFADNIFRVSAAYREYFLKVVRGRRFPGTLDRLLNLRQMLFDQVAYKTFYNGAWNNLFVAFYLVSCFVQTLCENNYAPFKELMIGAPGQVANSKLALYNQSIQKVLLESEVHLKDKSAIDVNDRQCLSRVFCRAIEEINEYVNGGDVDALPVYKTRIDLWSGILFRRDPDPDSSFYRLKLNVALYLLSFVESDHREIIQYLSNKIFASKLLNECVYIVGLLLAKEAPRRVHSRKEAVRDSAAVTGMPSEDDGANLSSALQEVDLDCKKLLELYRTNRHDFAEHIIIDLLFASFRFMRKLQEHDLRYMHFVNQLDAKVRPDLSKDNLANGEMLEASQAAEKEAADATDTPMTPNQLACWQFMSEVVCDVELTVDVKTEAGKMEPRLISYQFKKLPVCFFDTPVLQKRILAECAVESLEAKHEDFFNWVNKGIGYLEIEQENHIRLGAAAILISDKAFDVYLFLMYLIAVTINILCLVFYNVATDDYNSPRHGDATMAVRGLTIADAVLALVLLVAWLLFKYHSEKKLQLIEFTDTFGSHARMRTHQKVYYYGYRAMLSNAHFICLFAHLSLSLLGFWSAIFYCLMLFLILHFSSVLRGVCMAILFNLKRLFWTLVIIVIVINFFSLLATEYLNTLMADGYDTGCDSYFSCLLNSLNAGVVQDGGMRNMFLVQGGADSFRYTGLFFVKLGAFIFVNLFLLGMFFGIITDAFSEYVARLTEKDEDSENVCFCCGLKKHVLERYGITFREHQETHAIFKYMYYIIYLRTLDSNAYTGIDYQVDRMLKSSDKGGFLPRFTTLALEEQGAKLREDERSDSGDS